MKQIIFVALLTTGNKGFFLMDFSCKTKHLIHIVKGFYQKCSK